MMAIRSESLIASSMLCVTKITVFGSRCQILSSSSCMYSRVWMSSEANGSSIRRIDGLTASARAMLTRCRMPPESSRG